MRILQYGHLSLASSVTRPDTLFQSPLAANSAVFKKRKFGKIWQKKFGDLSIFAKFAKLFSRQTFVLYGNWLNNRRETQLRVTCITITITIVLYLKQQ